MSDNINVFYEITQKMNDKKQFQNDMNEVMSAISGVFRDKYLNRLNDALNDCMKKARDNPSPEIKLLHSMKPFLPEQNHKQIDNTVNMLVMLDTFKNFSTSQAKIMAEHTETIEVAESKDSAIHDDGIYEIDVKCLSRKKSGGNALMGLFMAFMLLG